MGLSSGSFEIQEHRTYFHAVLAAMSRKCVAFTISGRHIIKIPFHTNMQYKNISQTLFPSNMKNKYGYRRADHATPLYPQ
jgi:hypothetical protein